MPDEKKYGWYSQESADSGCSTSIYARPDGSEVEICFLTNSPTDPSGSKWPDQQCVGEIKRYIRDGSPGKYFPNL